MKNPKKAIHYEKLGKSRTFFVYNEESEEFEIVGYFSIALQVFKVPTTYSGNQIKKLDGFSANKGGQRIEEFPAILIGQFAKSDVHNSEISGEQLMNYCLGTILEGQELLGGRLIMLECKPVQGLINLYNQYGFSVIDEPQDLVNGLVQMVRILQSEEIV